MILACKKKLGKQTKKVGLGQTPPLVWEKFPRNIVFPEDVPKVGCAIAELFPLCLANGVDSQDLKERKKEEM